jgi:hypothetical protein
LKLTLKLKCYVCALAFLALFPLAGASAETKVSPAEARAIAKEAYIYGYPMVDAYRVMYTYFSGTENPEFKAPWNQIKNIPRVFTPADKAIVSPNSDTPYSMLGMDLRAEPMVLTVPAIDPKRYYSIQLIDAYTFNFDYIGSRTQGMRQVAFWLPGRAGQAPLPKASKRFFVRKPIWCLPPIEPNCSILTTSTTLRMCRQVMRLSHFLHFSASPHPLPGQQRTS